MVEIEPDVDSDKEMQIYRNAASVLLEKIKYRPLNDETMERAQLILVNYFIDKKIPVCGIKIERDKDREGIIFDDFFVRDERVEEFKLWRNRSD